MLPTSRGIAHMHCEHLLTIRVRRVTRPPCLQTPALAAVAPDRCAEVIASAYHLLQVAGACGASALSLLPCGVKRRSPNGMPAWPIPYPVHA